MSNVLGEPREKKVQILPRTLFRCVSSICKCTNEGGKGAVHFLIHEHRPLNHFQKRKSAQQGICRFCYANADDRMTTIVSTLVPGVCGSEAGL